MLGPQSGFIPKQIGESGAVEIKIGNTEWCTQLRGAGHESGAARTRFMTSEGRAPFRMPV